MSRFMVSSEIKEPSACRWCGIGKRDHAQRWTPAAGWHAWVMPPQSLIKSRMLRRWHANLVGDVLRWASPVERRG